MRISFLLVAFVIGLECTAQSSVEHIEQLMHDQVDSWNDANLEGFMTHYWQSDSLMFIGSSGLNFGWNNLMDRYQRAYADEDAMGELTFNILRTDVLSPSVILVIGEWEVVADSDTMSGLFSLNWKKLPGGWKIVCDHTGKSE